MPADIPKSPTARLLVAKPIRCRLPTLISLYSIVFLTACVPLFFSNKQVRLVPGYTASFERKDEDNNAKQVAAALSSYKTSEKILIKLDVPSVLRSYAVDYIKQIDAIAVEKGHHDFVLLIDTTTRRECLIAVGSSGYWKGYINYLLLSSIIRAPASRGGTVHFANELGACSSESHDYIARVLTPHSLRNLYSVNSVGSAR